MATVANSSSSTEVTSPQPNPDLPDSLNSETVRMFAPSPSKGKMKSPDSTSCCHARLSRSTGSGAACGFVVNLLIASKPPLAVSVLLSLADQSRSTCQALRSWPQQADPVALFVGARVRRLRIEVSSSLTFPCSSREPVRDFRPSGFGLLHSAQDGCYETLTYLFIRTQPQQLTLERDESLLVGDLNEGRKFCDQQSRDALVVGPLGDRVLDQDWPSRSLPGEPSLVLD